MQGWVKLHRSLADNEMWMAEPFTYGQAWVDLLIHANHYPKTIFIRNIEVELDRGQLGWSEVTMSKRWKWSRGKVRRYLGMLEKRGMIEQQKTQVTSIISVCNYSSYQDNKQQTEQPTEQQAEQPTDSTMTADGTQSKNEKNDKNEKKGGGSRTGSSPVTFTGWLNNLADEKPVPQSDPIFDYADDAGIPQDYLRVAWVEFKARYTDDSKRYKDWRAVFRRAVRGNWFKLWWIDAEGYKLTSLGQQAMTALNNKRGEE